MIYFKVVIEEESPNDPHKKKFNITIIIKLECPSRFHDIFLEILKSVRCFFAPLTPTLKEFKFLERYQNAIEEGKMQLLKGL